MAAPDKDTNRQENKRCRANRLAARSGSISDDRLIIDDSGKIKIQIWVVEGSAVIAGIV